MSTEMPCYRAWLGMDMLPAALAEITKDDDPELAAEAIRAGMETAEKERDKTCPDWNLPLCPSCQLRARVLTEPVWTTDEPLVLSGHFP